MERLLQPGQQIWADVGSIIGNQTPDKDGNMISQAVTAGSYEVRDVDNPVHGKVYEGKLILDKTYGHAAYGCGVCCGYKWVAFDPASYSGAVGNSTADFLLAGNACTGLSDDVTYSGYSWNSSNTAVATVQAGVFTTLVGAGTASGSAYATVPGTNIRQGCPDTAILATPQSITAKPTISGPNTLWWFKGLSGGVSGYATQVTLTANSGGNGASYQWAITSGSYAVSLSGSTSATVQVTSIGMSNSPNDVSITVTVNGVSSNPFKMTVRAPFMLLSNPAYPAPPYGPDSTFVWQIQIEYLVADQFKAPVPSPISINESWTSGIYADYPGENWRRGPAGCYTTPSATPAAFSDHIQGETTDRSPTPVYNTQEDGAAVYHWGQDWRVGTCTIGSGPRVQGDTLQKYIDHAAHTNIYSPDP
jgi:hypothetical protein